MYVEMFGPFYRVPVSSAENQRQQCVQNGQNLRKRGFERSSTEAPEPKWYGIAILEGVRGPGARGMILS